MAYKSLREFLDLLEADGDLKRVSRPVSTHLEMTEIQTRLLNTGGPAVLFENPVHQDGRMAEMPALANLFGTVGRVARAVTLGGEWCCKAQTLILTACRSRAAGRASPHR